MYAIVDIETTGSHAHQNGITEIAIILHNGKQIEGSYETLINPGYPIPRYVATLTGINDKMVAAAPAFNAVAQQVYNLLNGRIFIAHNVNFDYSFIKHHLRCCGYNWSAKKLCTLRLSRKAFPGIAKYGLENLCRELNIVIENRHRAGGDAAATSVLFDMILQKEGEKLIKEFLMKDGREQILPPNLPKEHVKQLPYTPGVYYFHDAKGKVIYVGKAKVLKYRVVSHFTGLDIGKKRQEFLKNIYAVSFKECPTEFTACILESVEIKRLWPAYNYSQKKYHHLYGIYYFEDAKGYMRLAIDKKRNGLQPLAMFNTITDAYRKLWKTVKQFELHPSLCFLDRTIITEVVDIAAYNIKVKEAIKWMQTQNETFVIKEEEQNVTSYILIEEGKFYGMGIVSADADHTKIDEIKLKLTPYPENEVMRSMIRNYAERYPAKVLKCV